MQRESIKNKDTGVNVKLSYPIFKISGLFTVVLDTNTLSLFFLIHLFLWYSRTGWQSNHKIHLPNYACYLLSSQACFEVLFQLHWQIHSPKTESEDTLLMSSEALLSWIDMKITVEFFKSLPLMVGYTGARSPKNGQREKRDS